MSEINWQKLEDYWGPREDAKIIYRWETSGPSYESEYSDYHDILDAYAVIEIYWPEHGGIRTHLIKGYVSARDEWVNGAKAGPLVAHLIPFRFREDKEPPVSPAQEALNEIFRIAAGQCLHPLSHYNDQAALRSIQQIAALACKDGLQ